MPKEKVKKVTYSIKGKYFSGEQQVSKEGIEVLMSNWKKACANFDEEKLKMASEKGKTTLLTLVQGHGVKGRIQLEGSSPARSMGGAQIVRAIDKFIQSSEEIDEEDEKSLQSALKRMKDMEKTYNPANVSFQNPIYKTVERRTLKVKREAWYGHYRTPDYVKFRKLKNKKLDKDDDKFTDAVPSHWYNKEKGEAKPPLWQALFGTKEENIDLQHDGLMHILEQGIDALDDIEIDNVELAILGLGTAKRVYGIPQIKKWFKDYVYDGTKVNHTGINANTGSMRDTHIANVLSKVPFKVTDPEESELIKELGKKKKIKGTVQTYKLRIARRQVRNIGFMLGLGKIGEIAVHLPTREEYNKKKEEGDNKAYIPKKNLGWMDILKAPMSEDELHERVPLTAPHEKVNEWEAEDLFEERLDPLIYESRRLGNRYIRFNPTTLLGMSIEAAMPLLIGWYPGFTVTEYGFADDTIDIHWTNRERPHQGGQG